MKTIEERAKEYADNFVVGDSAIIVDLLHKVAEESYIKCATEQKAIDDAELAEIKRQRDAYYDELLSKRQRIAELEAKLAQISEKTCEWLKRLPPQWEVYEDAHYEIDRDSIIEELRKYLEE